MIGFIFFPKERSEPELSQSEIERQQLIENVREQEKLNKEEKKLTEKEQVKTFAENFTKIYYSYVLGSFSNIESQYYYMTDEMKDKEENKVEKMKKEIEYQPQKYFTVRAKLASSTFTFYDKTKASLEIDLDIDNFAGAMAQRDTLVWVDENGNYYEGDETELITNTTAKNIKIDLVKIDDQWKVDRIEEK
ncbi:MAG: hypothetical protein KAI71_00445 [Candidatus Pacebacteria bacterium]|nr:hypothetical protein [Candidatus Paceibacterota bacterium]